MAFLICRCVYSDSLVILKRRDPCDPFTQMVRCEMLSARQLLESEFARAIDELGEKSALAQHLKRPITSSRLLQELVAHGDNTTHGGRDARGIDSRETQAFVLAFLDDEDDEEQAEEADTHQHQTQCIGFLKIGPKHLFYLTPQGRYLEIDMTCVLDFYVDESHQRRGVGLRLFQHLLQTEALTPVRLAYDRPSPKLFCFLAKHFGLREFVPQPNRFVVFDGFLQQSDQKTNNHVVPRFHAKQEERPEYNTSNSSG